MIDNLAIGITHLLLVIAIIRLLARNDLDKEPVKTPELSSTPDHPDAPAPAQNGALGSRVGIARLPGLGRNKSGGGGPRV